MVHVFTFREKFEKLLFYTDFLAVYFLALFEPVPFPLMTGSSPSKLQFPAFPAEGKGALLPRAFQFVRSCCLRLELPLRFDFEPLALLRLLWFISRARPG